MQTHTRIPPAGHGSTAHALVNQLGSLPADPFDLVESLRARSTDERQHEAEMIGAQLVLALGDLARSAVR